MAIFPGRRLFASKPVFMCCDLQGRMAKHMRQFDDLVYEANRFSKIAQVLNIPFITTEMFQSELGPTDPRILLPPTAPRPFAKNQFSMMTAEVQSETLAKGYREFVLFGIETHACVLQTAAHLCELGDDVHVWVIENATYSQYDIDRESALTWLRGQPRTTVATSEMFAGGLVREGMAHPKFGEITSLVVKKRQPTEAKQKQEERALWDLLLKQRLQATEQQLQEDQGLRQRERLATEALFEQKDGRAHLKQAA